MDFRKLFRYEFIAACLVGNSIATDTEFGNKPGVGKKTICALTIDELHNLAKDNKKSIVCSNNNPPISLTITTEKGIIFETLIDSWDTNKNAIQRALNLTKYDETCCLEKDGILKKVIFRYSPNSGTGISLEVDLTGKNINAENFYPQSVLSSEGIISNDKISYSVDGTKFITFNDQNLVFTILQ